jgi:carbamoyl-phosphate synthase large subunit
MRTRERPVIAVSGLHRGDNPQPGPAVIRSVRRVYGSATVLGLSYDPLESGLFSTDLDRVDAAFSLPLPAMGANALLDRLEQIRQTNAIDLIVPCLDAEIPNYFALLKELRRRGIEIVLPTSAAFERRSKEKLATLGLEAGVAVPRTLMAPDLAAAYRAGEQIGYPLFMKGRLYEALKLTSPAEIANAFHYLTSVWGGPVMVQEPIVGEEYDVTGLGDGTGDLAGSCSIRKMMLTKTGKAYAGIVISDPTLDVLVGRIVKALSWNGPFEIEFVRGPRGYVLIEMNPRFPAWIDFPSQIGCNLPAALVQRAIGGAGGAPGRCEAGRMFVRHAVDLVGDIAELAELSVTGARNRNARTAVAEVTELVR